MSKLPNALCEENKDEEDLINLTNPPKQLNHYQKPASKLKSMLKTSKLHATQKRSESFGPLHSQNFMQENPMATHFAPPRANSANSKSKFLTKTNLNQGEEQPMMDVRPVSVSEQQ